MIPTNDPHPSPEQLATFSLDRLPSGERRFANDGTLRLWDVASGKQVYSFSGHGEGIVLGVAFLPDRRGAISGGRDGTFRI
jgi:WD40 repeat protein